MIMLILRAATLGATLFAVVLGLSSCSGSTTSNPQEQSQFNQIQSLIFTPRCASCHNGGSDIPLDLSSADSSYTALLGENFTGTDANNAVANANAWKLVNPGNAEKSFLIRKLKSPGVGEGMPMPNLSTALSEASIAFIADWINQGAQRHATARNTLEISNVGILKNREHTQLMFEKPESCAQCHEQHVKEWSMSSHAYAAVDPVFWAMTRMGQKATKGKLGQFCLQCHSPVGFVREELPIEFDPITEEHFQDQSKLSEVAKQGVSCDVCHSIESVIEPLNARMSMTPNGTKLGTIENPVSTNAHNSAFSPLHTESEVCAPCHNVVNPKDALLEETFTEWQNSSFALPGENKRTCQSCHMPASQGIAADGGPERTIHNHLMAGVDVSLLAPEEFPGYYELREASAELLRSAADLSAEFTDDSQLAVTIKNNAGHALPSGATAERQMWIEVNITAPDGELLFSSGMLDERGDLMDGNPKHSLNPKGDPQLVKFAQDFLDSPDALKEVPKDENYYYHVVAMPWQAAGIRNHLIEADATVTHTYDLSAINLTPGSTAAVKIKFRSFPMYFLRLLEEAAGLDPEIKTRVPIVVMQEATVNF